MTIPRLQIFELEDLPWFPHTIRDLVTDHPHFLETRFALHESLLPLLRGAIEKSRVERIVDLCSGGGGLVLRAYESLKADGINIPFTLTDKYPNLLHSIACLHFIHQASCTSRSPSMRSQCRGIWRA